MTDESIKNLKRLTALCSKREKCENEALNYMLQKGSSKEDAISAVEYLVENQFIDNKRYAKSFVRDKFRFNKWGRNKIVNELKLKKISQEDISSALEDEDFENLEKENLEKELTKKLRTEKSCPKEKIFEKLLRLAVTKGYNYQTAKELIEKLLKEI